jgi:hypothetical protein
MLYDVGGGRSAVVSEQSPGLPLPHTLAAPELALTGRSVTSGTRSHQLRSERLPMRHFAFGGYPGTCGFANVCLGTQVPVDPSAPVLQRGLVPLRVPAQSTAP